MSELISSQDRYTVEIKQVYTSYKKIPRDRRTTQQLLGTINDIKHLWEKVEETHKKIIETPKTKYEERNPYFVDNLFDKAREIKDSFLKVLIEDPWYPIQQPEILSPRIEGGEDQPNFNKNLLQEQRSRYIILQHRFTSFFKQIERLNDMEKEDILKPKAAAIEHKSLKEDWATIEDDHLKIIAHEHEGKFTEEFTERFEEQFENLQKAYFSKLSQLVSRLDGETSKQEQPGRNFKIPAVKIPSFDGKQSDWQGFADIFRKLIHEESGLLNIQKFLTLKPLLKGEAEKLLSQLPITDANYELAWELLNEKYNNRRVQVNMHINNLKDLPPVTKGSREKTCEQLACIHDLLNENLRGLENLNVSKEEALEAVLVNLTLEKLDIATVIAFEQGLEDQKAIPRISQLLKFIEARSATLIGAAAAARPKEQYHSHQQRQPQKHGYVHLANQKRKCYKCDESHDLNNCPQFHGATVNERWGFIKKENICPCLRHYKKGACRTKPQCSKCHYEHDSLLHSDNTSQNKGSWAPNSNKFRMSRDDQKMKNGQKVSYSANNNIKEKIHRSNQQASDQIQAAVPEGYWTFTNTEKKSDKSNQPSVNVAQVNNQITPQNTQPNNSNRTNWNAMMAQSYGVASKNRQTVLLPTALVKIESKWSPLEKTTLRMLIDQGSTCTMISRRAVQLLRLKEKISPMEVIGVGETSAGSANTSVTMVLEPHIETKFKLPIVAHVMKKLTSAMPASEVPFDVAPDFEALSQYTSFLADPTFNQPGEIDIILGNDYYPQIAKPGLLSSGQGLLAQNTNFGWVISGPVRDQPNHVQKITCHTVTIKEISDELVRFMTQEEPMDEAIKNPEKQALDDKCEQEYLTNVERQPDGRYIVKMSFEKETIELGDSRRQAVARLFQVERKLTTNAHLRKEYNDFMKKYIELGHMEKIPANSAALLNTQVNYLPHHCVVNEGSLSTKVRVVFDGSCVTSNGNSINDLMLAGPRLQENLDAILIRWRTWKFAYTADIEKMYRQILIHQDQQDLQRIVWRFSSNEPIDAYRLKTVTYGTKMAPYLAIRTLQQLARDEEKTFPEASKIALRDFYVDDVLSGADTINEAQQRVQELINLMEAGKLTLRKWSSNDKKVLPMLPDDFKVSTAYEISEESIKTLGLQWNPNNDNLSYKITHQPVKLVTRRTVLSGIARIYDPLGLLAPVLIVAKMLMQEVWSDKSSWDEELSLELQKRWRKFEEESAAISNLVIPRWVNTLSTKPIQLIGFCDASGKAYAACVYVRTIIEGQVHMQLLVSKTRVSPLKNPQTLPRLELCGALLLADLLTSVKKALLTPNAEVHAFTDSQVVLGWLNGEPNRWNVYVKNKVLKINSQVNPNSFYHVRSEDNSADVASRGISALKLQSYQLWWNGPSFLHDPRWTIGIQVVQPTTIEMRTRMEVVTVNTTRPMTTYIERFSSFLRASRVAAYCLRWKSKETGTITAKEVEDAQAAIIRAVQLQEFPQGRKEKNLANLNPIFGADQLLRVGGRLELSDLEDSTKHPIILPKNHHISKLIVNEAHKSLLHGGPTAVEGFVKEKFWIVGLRQTIKSQLKKCIVCTRHTGKVMQQLMGQLPRSRTVIAPPFTETMVDFLGPISIKANKLRKAKITKGYVCIFKCMKTLACHIEPVSELTGDAFLGALKRFCGRRSTCKHIYSDNGKNFVMGNRVMNEDMLRAIDESSKRAAIIMANQGVQWHFSPPLAPHMNGLIERNVRSFKHHFYRVTENQILTIEELFTLTAQIEGILNSRPLLTLTEDPNNLEALTPGHFLVGRQLVLPIEPSYKNEVIPPLKRWRQVQQLVSKFWTTWSKSYILELQNRAKWTQSNENIKIGDLVIVKNEELPSCRWPLARVVETHAGADGLIRVVTVQINEQLPKGGVKPHLFKRTIAKICKLPTDDDYIDKGPQPINDKEIIDDRETSATNIAISKNSNKNENTVRTSSMSQVHRQSGINIGLRTLAMFMLIVATVVGGKPAVTFNPITEPGLMITHEGTAFMHLGTWHWVTNTTLNITRDIQFLEKEVEKFKNNTNKLISRYPSIKWDVAAQYHSLHHAKVVISSLNHQKKKHRVKRNHGSPGLFGYLKRFFIGTSSSEEDLSAMARQQETIVKRTSGALHSTMETMKKAETHQLQLAEALQTKINEMQTHLNTQITETSQFEASTSIFLAAMTLDTTVKEMTHRYTMVRDATLISPEEFDVGLRNITDKIPEGAQVLQMKISDVRQEIHVSQGEISVVLHVPIVSKISYEKLNVIPVPCMKTRQLWKLDYTKLYFDLETLNYAPAAEEDVLYRLSDDRIIAEFPVIRNAGKLLDCVTASILKRKGTNQVCHSTRMSPDTEVIHKLENSNKILYYSDDYLNMSVTCKKERYEATAPAGIVTLIPGCTLTSSRYTVYASTDVTSRSSPITFIPAHSEDQLPKMPTIETPFEELQLNITAENTDEAMNAIMTLEKTNLQMTFTEWSRTTVIIVSVAATLLTIIIIVVWILCKNMKIMRQSQPPRRTEPEWIGLRSADIMTPQRPRREINSETTTV